MAEPVMFCPPDVQASWVAGALVDCRLLVPSVPHAVYGFDSVEIGVICCELASNSLDMRRNGRIVEYHIGRIHELLSAFYMTSVARQRMHEPEFGQRQPDGRLLDGGERLGVGLDREARIALDVRCDLLDQPPDPYRFVATVSDTGGTGFAQNLRFTSRAHVGFEKSFREGIAEIIYYIKAGDDGHLTLKRADNLYPYPEFEEKGSDPALCKHVKSLSFKFYDKEGTEFDVWDSDSDEFGYATPKAIAIKLELANKAASHTFETMVSLPVSREKTD